MAQQRCEMPDRCRLENFDQLRQLALPEYRNQFQLEVVCPAARFGCGYTLKVNDQILYQCENVLEKSNNRDVNQLSFFHAANIRMKMEDMVYLKMGIEADGEMDYLSFYKNASLSRLFNISPDLAPPSPYSFCILS
ncbi:hypothetical protein JZM24_16640 [Candidatus Sodalis endolongispinus]|uniref:Uncharacterized protein n=1 Tax=Candidatus Sodalis endolongispinus TaxID=2812662 RepID=A0ABS5YEE2_9GAMM|nr:hypothetical protein [Candidatus Sodalis endolongispinus]MBT9433327.1 hypothetical protein [Candidatus Sodalis endolongispinus]